MTSSDYIFLILCGVSVVLLAMASFPRVLARLWAAVCLLWLGAALPVMFFLAYSLDYVLLFYLISGAVGLLFLIAGGRRT